jgi:hypothetical protein
MSLVWIFFKQQGLNPTEDVLIKGNVIELRPNYPRHFGQLFFVGPFWPDWKNVPAIKGGFL